VQSARFSVLGAVSIGGVTAPVVGKRRRLLALLLSKPQQVLTTDWLIDELWGATPPPSARNALHGHVTALRKLVDSADRPILTTHGNGYLLDTHDIDWLYFDAECDAGDEAVRRGDLDSALRVLDDALRRWRGDPYDGLTDPTDTLGRHATRLRESHRRAHLAWGVPALLVGAAAAVTERCAATLPQFPFDEELAAVHAIALAETGRVVEAIETLRDLRTRLRRDLGLSPGPAVGALEIALLEPDVRPDALLSAARLRIPAGGSAASTSLTTPPARRHGPPSPTPATCVGRDDLLGQWLRGGAASPTGTWVTGPAGRGKTRLLVEAAAQATKAADTFVAVAATDDADTLRATRSIAGTAEVEAALARLAAAQTPRAEVEANLASLVRDRCVDDERVLWLIDDADRLSPSDRAVVLRMLAEPPSRLSVVMASRFPPPPALAALVEQVDLPPLHRDDVVALAADLPDSVADAIATASAGEPLLAATLIRLAGASAELPPAVAATSAASIDEAVADALSRLYRQATTPGQHLAALLAVADTSIAVEALGGVFDDVAGAVVHAVADGLVTIHRDRIALSHALLRDQIMATLPRPMAEHLAHVAARIVAATAPHSAARLRTSLVGDGTAATRHALADAGSVALRALALDEAARIGELLIEISPPGASTRLDGELLVEHADIDARDAARTARRLDLWQRCLHHGDIRQVCAAAALALGQWQDSGGPSLEFAALLRRSVELAADHPAARAELLTTAVASRLGAGESSLTESLEAMTLATQVDDPALSCRALVARCYSLIGGGNISERRRLATTALQLATRAGLAQATVAAAAQLLIAACTAEGPHSDDAEWAREAHAAVAATTRRPLHEWRHLVVNSAAAMHRGDWDDAQRQVDAACRFGVANAIGDALPTRVVQELFLRVTDPARATACSMTPATALGSRSDARPLVIASHLAAAALRGVDPDAAMVQRDSLVQPADYLRPAALWLGCWYATVVGDQSLLHHLQAADTSGRGGVVVAMGIALPGALPGGVTGDLTGTLTGDDYSPAS
jgi:DNA-binding SARP family transcriptional activator/RecA/RadA recombinase